MTDIVETPSSECINAKLPETPKVSEINDSQVTNNINGYSLRSSKSWQSID